MNADFKFCVSLVKSYFIMLLVICIPFGWTRPVWAAKDYRIESVTIDAQLNSDGSMDVKEKRTYTFNGHFHWATYFLPTENTGGVINFAISENGRPYLRSRSEVEGIYRLNEDADLSGVRSYLLTLKIAKLLVGNTRQHIMHLKSEHVGSPLQVSRPIQRISTK